MATTAGQLLLQEKHNTSEQVELQEEVQHPTQIKDAMAKGMTYFLGAWVLLFIVVIVGVAIERKGTRKSK